MKTNVVEVVNDHPSVAEIVRLFDELKHSGCIFTASFVKKDNSIRVMNCRTKVKKHLKGGSLPYNASQKGLLPVYDLKKKEYRVVNLNTVRWVVFGGVRYIFKG